MKKAADNRISASAATCTVYLCLLGVALPLTVTSIGEDIFHECVSLELVSLPEGLTANRNDDSDWVVYYPDSALYRGDNGNTLQADPWEPGDEIDQDSDFYRTILREGVPIAA